MRNRESALEISEDPQSKWFKIAERSAFYPPTIYIDKWTEIIYVSVDDVGNFSVCVDSENYSINIIAYRKNCTENQVGITKARK